MTDENSIFGKYPTAKWTVAGSTIMFPVARVEETHVNRVVEHERMHRKGARCDNTGPKAKAWRLTVEAYNSSWHEDGVFGESFYPDELNRLLDSFDEEDTGDLVLPTRGPRRCKAREYTRVEEAGERDAAAVTLLFVEDNEDDATAAAWQAPKAQSVIVKKASDAVRACEDQAPMKKDGLTSLRENAAAIESYANAPFDYVGDLEQRVSAVVNMVNSIEDTYTKRAGELQSDAQAMLTDPMSSRAGRILREVSDTASRAVGDRLTRGPVPYPKVYPWDTTLFAVAASEAFDLSRLLQLNPALDPFFVAAGTAIMLER